ncbi:MAG: hypothetical protein H0S80_14165 [Desulfovibrionaceae bacterium]|nr:hypothetical protein [Desulfovibrionaceae bacterium]
MPVKSILFSLMFAAVVLWPVAGHADGGLIHWGVTDDPPFHIVSGPDVDTGYSDMSRRFFAKRLTEYDHRKVRLTLARLMENARHGENYCYCNLLRTPERDKLFYFSDITAIAPGARLYVRQGSPILDLARDGEIGLEALLRSGRYVGVAEIDRFFGPNVQELFRTYNSSMLRLVTADVEQKCRMVHSRRVDFFIEYPFVLGHYVKIAGKKQGLVPIRIAEHDPYVFSHVACTKTDFGKRVIKRINEELRVAKGTDAYRFLFDMPARDLGEVSRREYAKLYDKFMKMN